jgi:hypothetical protein
MCSTLAVKKKILSRCPADFTIQNFAFTNLHHGSITLSQTALDANPTAYPKVIYRPSVWSFRDISNDTSMSMFATSFTHALLNRNDYGELLWSLWAWSRQVEDPSGKLALLF